MNGMFENNDDNRVLRSIDHYISLVNYCKLNKKEIIIFYLALNYMVIIFFREFLSYFMESLLDILYNSDIL